MSKWLSLIPRSHVYKVFFAALFFSIAVSILAVIFSFWPKQDEVALNNLSNSAFCNPFHSDTTSWTFKTFVKTEGLDQLNPAIITAYGESRFENNGGPASDHTNQYGYSIHVPCLVEISSRLQRSLEYQVGYHQIFRVVISLCDTTRSEEWKNCQKTVQW